MVETRTENGPAVLVTYCSVFGRFETPVREYTVSEVKPHAQYDRSVSILYTKPGKRLSERVTVTPDNGRYQTIEKGGQVIYDSRTDVPCDMVKFTATDAKMRERERLYEQQKLAAALIPQPPRAAPPRLVTVTTQRQTLDVHGRCCGRKPTEYRREGKLCCFRCDRAFDLGTKEQIPNYCFRAGPNGGFVSECLPGEVPDFMRRVKQPTDLVEPDLLTLLQPS